MLLYLRKIAVLHKCAVLTAICLAQAKKEMKSNRILLFVFTCCLSSVIHGQSNENTSIQSVKLWCENDSITIYIPDGYLSTDTFNYMEGYIQTFFYPDSSTVSILCGANATLSIGEYEVDELYSRKINYKYHDVTYERVTSKMKAVFDESFDMMEKKK